ncbi:MAG: hypothetical protein KC615_10570 [Anaerolineae bacterium]|nr:hypothetical protein [Anaerolineae bacterium]MCA9893418.1 hypothetical protein [Anaerolineae bacterium]MCB9461349.1 hypothetical protein [Anaerolineaceae bacterium]
MTKAPKGLPARFGWNMFLTLHAIAYTMLWLLILINNLGNPWTTGEWVPLLLIWTPLLFVHIALHYYALGKHNNEGDAYHLYRAGYRDAMRDLVDMSRLEEQDYEAIKTRLQLSENGQNPLTQEKQKRGSLQQ